MRQSVTQQQDYGCGVACFAFATGIDYEAAVHWLGDKQANSDRFYVNDFREALNRYGLNYSSKHIKKNNRVAYKEGSIVLVRRSKLYPAGHYLIRHKDKWMDPWINLPTDKRISNARSGYRQRLPGSAMYVLHPGYKS